MRGTTTSTPSSASMTGDQSAAYDAPAMYARDVDGTGSLHPCAKDDPGAIALWADSSLEVTFMRYRAYVLREAAKDFDRDDWPTGHGALMSQAINPRTVAAHLRVMAAKAIARVTAPPSAEQEVSA